MRQAEFFYTDKDNFKHTFKMGLMNLNPQGGQEVTLKQLNISKRKLFDLIGKKYNPKQDHINPVVVFFGWTEQEQDVNVIQENLNPISAKEWNGLIYIEQGGQNVVVEKERVKTLVSLLLKIS